MPARLTDADLIATHAEWLRQGRDAAKVAAILGLSSWTIYNRLGIAVRRGLVVIEGPIVGLANDPNLSRKRGRKPGRPSRINNPEAPIRPEKRRRTRIDNDTLLRTHAEWIRQGRSGDKAARALGLSLATIYIRLKECAARNLVADENDLPKGYKSKVESIDQLWTAYTSACATDTRKLLILRNRIAEHYWPIVLKFVRNFCFNRKLTEAGAIESAASEALLLAIPKFEPARGYQFMSFFGQRLNGAMLDECRNQDYATRPMRAKQKQRIEAERQLANGGANGHGTGPDAIKQMLGWSDEEYRTSLVPRLDSVESLVASAPSQEHVDKFSHSQASSAYLPAPPARRDFDVDDTLREMLRGCTLTETVVCFLYYKCERTMREIGEALNLSESRVSQVHSFAVEKMRKKGFDALVEVVAG